MRETETETEGKCDVHFQEGELPGLDSLIGLSIQAHRMLHKVLGGFGLRCDATAIPSALGLHFNRQLKHGAWKKKKVRPTQFKMRNSVI